jgi:hypothetical protein
MRFFAEAASRRSQDLHARKTCRRVDGKTCDRAPAQATLASE